MLACLQRRYADRRMQHVGQADTDRVDIRSCEQLLVLAVGARHLVLGRHPPHPVVVQPRQRDDLDLGDLRVGAQMDRADAGPDHAYSETLITHKFWFLWYVKRFCRGLYHSSRALVVQVSQPSTRAAGLEIWAGLRPAPRPPTLHDLLTVNPQQLPIGAPIHLREVQLA